MRDDATGQRILDAIGWVRGMHTTNGRIYIGGNHTDGGALLDGETPDPQNHRTQTIVVNRARKVWPNVEVLARPEGGGFDIDFPGLGGLLPVGVPTRLEAWLLLIENPPEGEATT